MLSGRHRNGKADTQRSTRARIDRGVDPDEVPAGVDEGSPGIAGIDWRIGLDEILEGVDAQVRAAERLDDPHGDSLADSERIAYGQHHVADDNVFHAAQRYGR